MAVITSDYDPTTTGYELDSRAVIQVACNSAASVCRYFPGRFDKAVWIYKPLWISEVAGNPVGGFGCGGYSLGRPCVS
jgi:hypothetical protein